MKSRSELEAASTDELLELRQNITDILDERRPGLPKGMHRYEFAEGYHPEKQIKPYVARLVLAPGGRVARHHYHIPKTGKGTKYVNLRGSYQACDFDLIETFSSRLSGRTVDEYRDVCIAYGGELFEVCEKPDVTADDRFVEYLSGRRMVFMPVLEDKLEREKLRSSRSPYVVKCEQLLSALRTES